MAEVVLKNIKKVYPFGDRHEKKEAQGRTNLKVTEEGVLAVQDFNLTIADREFIVLVGPSGCGKSTTLNMIAGLEEISGGDLLIDGKRVNDVEPQDRDIAMVFQSYALYPHMSVYDNMSFALKLKHVPKEEIDRRVREAADILDITEYLKRKPKALSGGQRQRVAIGRAIVRNPKVFLMDEPLSNLDAKLRNQMRAEIIKLRKRINTTFVDVTHDQTEAMTLGDRIVVMKDGVVQQIGTPVEVYNNPSNLFVAGFMGAPQMNFFDAHLDKDSRGSYSVFLGGRNIDLPKEKQEKLAAKNTSPQDITLGIRPEHIVVKEDGTGVFSGTVDVSEMLGGAIHLHINTLDTSAIIVVQTVNLSSPQTAFTGGSEVCYDMDPRLIHLFDKTGGQNLVF